MAVFGLIFITSLLFGVYGHPSEACGFSGQDTGFVINGAQTHRGKWPWLVALFLKEKVAFFCGASLISDRHMLTAAHCIQQKDQEEPLKPNEIVAYLGKHYLPDIFEKDSLPTYPWKVVVHHEWSYDDLRYEADLAMIILKHAVAFNSYISPICLWASNDVMIPDNGFVVNKRTAKIFIKLTNLSFLGWLGMNFTSKKLDQFKK